MTHTSRERAKADVDVAIIGAGPAGTAAAALLHRAGHSVRVFEQGTFPRFVIGESLLPHCMDILDEAGLLEAAKGRGYLEKFGALFVRGQERCSFLFSEQWSPGWTWTWQVPRDDFDKTLADAAIAQGVPIHFRHAVRDVDFSDGPRLRVADEEGRESEVRARFVIDASGYGRVLPRLLHLDEPSHLPTRASVFTHVTGDRRPPGPDENRIWICIHDAGAWIWIIPFSDGRASVGAVAEPAFLSRYAGDGEAQLRAILDEVPAARERLRDMQLLWAPKRLEGYSISVKQLYGDGYCLVGNATEFLDPVFSSGVTLALASAGRAARLVSAQLRGEAVDWQRDYAEHMMRGIDVFRAFVNGWYDGTVPSVFFLRDHDPATRAQICSVLAGYVWDEKNPFVRDPARRLRALAKLATLPGRSQADALTT